MSIISFLKLIEIQTKVASVIPFSLGTVYALYRFKQFNFNNFLLMFISLIVFDMTTTAINNYYDYKRAIKKHGYGYESHNAIVSYNIKESTVRFTILVLLLIAVVSGILLFINTSVVVLLIGMLSFAIGILYSFGPVPISRTPLGEIFSGLTMGFIITLLSVYIHVVDLNIISVLFNDGLVGIQLNLKEFVFIFLVSIPPVMGIANIMLSNNICDIEEDKENNRFTLPIYIGKGNALKVFKAAYYFVYIDIVILLLLGVVPAISVISLLTLIPVYKHIKIFDAKQSKAETFVLAVKNFVLINIVYVLLIGINVIIDYRLLE